MRNYVIFILLLLLWSCRDNNTDFKPVDISIIKAMRFDNISVEHIHNSTNGFKTVWELTPYLSELESLRTKNLKNYKSIDSLEHYATLEGIRKTLVLRSDSLNGKKVVVYFSGELDNEGYGCWIAMFDAKSHRWKHYYTGLTSNKFYHLKAKGAIPLFCNDSLIQLEAALVRKIKPEILPSTLPEYELLEDSLVLKINLNKTTLDTDHDGITDIVEKKYMTDLTNPDTDGDGIIDSEDKNPRFKSEDSEFSLLVNFLLNGYKKPRETKFYIDFNKPEFTYCKDDTLYKVIMLVSDDKRLKHVDFHSKTYIVIDRDEYYDIANINATPLTLFFSVEKIKHNVFKINIDGSGSGVNYIITKAKEGWLIEQESSYIS